MGAGCDRCCPDQARALDLRRAGRPWFRYWGKTDINATLRQPFLSLTSPPAWTCTVTTGSTYDREAKNWSVPITATIAKLTQIGAQPISPGGGLPYWVDSSETGPDGWGGRFIVTFLFPS